MCALFLFNSCMYVYVYVCVCVCAQGWWKVYTRPMMFISVFIVIFTFILGFKLIIWFNEDEYYVRVLHPVCM